jgi:transmembrane sensor
MSTSPWEMLDRFLAQEGTRAERERIERWLEERPRRALHAGLLMDAVIAEAPVSRHSSWVVVLRELQPLLPVPQASILWVSAASRRLVFTGAVLATLAAVWWPLASLRQSSDRMSLRTLKTPPGQRATFQLPDGTEVMLGVASTLRHAATWGPRSKDVFLEGEAYFDVNHDENRPFVVHARNLTAEDLGTEFIVRAYPEDTAPQVIVRAGRVRLHHATRSTTRDGQVVLAGHVGQVDPTGGISVRQADTAARFAWTHGWLVFDAVPLRDAIPHLSRWYDLTFRLSDSSLGSILLTANLRNQPTDDALLSLAGSLGLRHVSREGTVTFYAAHVER